MSETKLPDFEEMIKITNRVRDLTLKKLILETEISEMEADAISYHTNHTTVNGKPPSMQYLTVTVKPTGRN
jgi:hypothetical protein